MNNKNLVATRILAVFFAFSSILLLGLLLGCSKKESVSKQVPVAEEEVAEISTEQAADYFRFFHYSKDGFSFCEKPDVAPDVFAKPWTETFRTSDSAVGKNGDGFLLVNKLGMMVFSEGRQGESSSFSLMRDMKIFDDGTAGNLVFSEGHPFFTLHKNVLFEKSLSSNSHSGSSSHFSASSDSFSLLEKNASRSYIIRASVDNNAFFPVITYADLGIETGEVTGTFFDGQQWISSIKTTTNDSTSFRYVAWKPASSLLAMQPYYREGKISFSEIDTTTYRKALEIKPFSAAPQRLINLLGKVPKKIDFTIELKDSDGTSPRTFVSGEDSIIDAKAIISPNWICCVFEDGTVYFNGGLKGRELANRGLNFAFRLPKLKEGFVYTYFTVSGSNLVVGWEEKDFFRVGKAGFLMADFEKILYK